MRQPQGTAKRLQELQDRTGRRIELHRPDYRAGSATNNHEAPRIVKQLVNRGAAGDPKAMPTLLGVINASEAGAESDPAEDNGFKEEEALVVDSIMRRIRETAPDPLNAGDEGSPSPDKDSPETEER
jgi:hypothetical protein